MNILIVVLILAVGGLAGVAHSLSDKLKASERNYVQVTRHFDSKVGGTSLLGDGEYLNYQLKTFDSGRTWYAIEYDDDWGVTILGEAEIVYPGLLAHIEGMDALMKHVEENGPISGFQHGEVELLENAGFEVKGK